MTENAKIPCCNVCLGESNQKFDCICGGGGTVYDENIGLRREIYRLKKENELLKSQTVEDLKKILSTISKNSPNCHDVEEYYRED